MSTSARKFTATTDSIAITPTSTLSGAIAFSLHFAFKLDSGATTLGGSNPDGALLFGQWGNSNASNIILFGYSDQTNPFDATSPPGSGNFLTLYVSDGNGHYQNWVSTFDPFAGMAGDGNWHYLTLEWMEYDAHQDESWRLLPPLDRRHDVQRDSVASDRERLGQWPRHDD